VLNLGLKLFLLLERASMILIEIAQELNHGINLFLNPETEVEITKKSGSLGSCFLFF